MLQASAEGSESINYAKILRQPSISSSVTGEFYASSTVNACAVTTLNNSMPCTTPIIGQKRSQRRAQTPSTGSPMVSTNTTLNTSISDQSSVFFSFNESRNSFLQTSPSSTLSTRNSLASCVSAPPSSTNLSCKVTIPKAPKPQRTLLIFENVIIGLK